MSIDNSTGLINDEPIDPMENDLSGSNSLILSSGLHEHLSQDFQVTEPRGVDATYLKHLYNNSNLFDQGTGLLSTPKHTQKGFGKTRNSSEASTESSSVIINVDVSENSSSSVTEDSLEEDDEPLDKLSSEDYPDSGISPAPEKRPSVFSAQDNQRMALKRFDTRVFMLVNGIPVFARRHVCAVTSKVPLGVFSFHTLYCKTVRQIPRTKISGKIPRRSYLIFAGINADNFIDDILKGNFSSSVRAQNEAILEELENTFINGKCTESYLDGSTPPLGLYATLLVPEVHSRKDYMVCNAKGRRMCACHRREYNMTMADIRTMKLFRRFHLGKSYYVYGFGRFQIKSRKKSTPRASDSICLLVNFDGHMLAIQNTFVAARRFFYNMSESVLKNYRTDEYVFDYRNQSQSDINLFLENGIDINEIGAKCKPVKAPELSQKFISWLGNFQKVDDRALIKLSAREKTNARISNPPRLMSMQKPFRYFVLKRYPIPIINVTPTVHEVIAVPPRNTAEKGPSLALQEKKNVAKEKVQTQKLSLNSSIDVLEQGSVEQLPFNHSFELESPIAQENQENIENLENQENIENLENQENIKNLVNQVNQENQEKEETDIVEQTKRMKMSPVQEITTVDDANLVHPAQAENELFNLNQEPEPEPEPEPSDEEKQDQSLQNTHQPDVQEENDFRCSESNQEQQLLQIQQLELVMKQQEWQQEQHKLLMKLQSTVPQTLQDSYARQVALLSRQKIQMQLQKQQLQLMEQSVSCNIQNKTSLDKMLKNEQAQFQLQCQLQKIQLRLSQNLIKK